MCILPCTIFACTLLCSFHYLLVVPDSPAHLAFPLSSKLQAAVAADPSRVNGAATTPCSTFEAAVASASPPYSRSPPVATMAAAVMVDAAPAYSCRRSVDQVAAAAAAAAVATARRTPFGSPPRRHNDGHGGGGPPDRLLASPSRRHDGGRCGGGLLARVFAAPPRHHDGGRGGGGRLARALRAPRPTVSRPWSRRAPRFLVPLAPVVPGWRLWKRRAPHPTAFPVLPPQGWQPRWRRPPGRLRCARTVSQHGRDSGSGHLAPLLSPPPRRQEDGRGVRARLGRPLGSPLRRQDGGRGSGGCQAVYGAAALSYETAAADAAAASTASFPRLRVDVIAATVPADASTDYLLPRLTYEMAAAAVAAASPPYLPHAPVVAMEAAAAAATSTVCSRPPPRWLDGFRGSRGSDAHLPAGPPCWQDDAGDTADRLGCLLLCAPRGRGGTGGRVSDARADRPRRAAATAVPSVHVAPPHWELAESSGCGGRATVHSVERQRTCRTVGSWSTAAAALGSCRPSPPPRWAPRRALDGLEPVCVKAVPAWSLAEQDLKKCILRDGHFPLGTRCFYRDSLARTWWEAGRSQDRGLFDSGDFPGHYSLTALLSKKTDDSSCS